MLRPPVPLNGTLGVPVTTVVGVYVFPEVEVLDFAGPYEVFTTASRVHARLNPREPEAFRVVTISQTSTRVRARAGLEFSVDHQIVEHPPLDILIVPGGVVSDELRQSAVIDWIAETSQGCRVTASVCTGAFLLGASGLLKDKSATTHWEDIADLRAMFPTTRVLEGQLWVDEGRVVTSAGISAGIHMSLHLVRVVAGDSLARATARQMEFDWRSSGRADS